MSALRTAAQSLLDALEDCWMEVRNNGKAARVVAAAEELRFEIAEDAARPDPLGEALNSGDGAYRP